MNRNPLILASLVVATGVIVAAFILADDDSGEAASVPAWAEAAAMIQEWETTKPSPTPRKVSGTATDARHQRVKEYAGADLDLSPVRATLITRQADGSLGETRAIFRAADAIQLGRDDSAEFFWLERNPIDRGRLHGYHVRHAYRHILEYTEADLEAEGISDSWEAMASFGIREEDLTGLKEDGRRESAFGLDFACLLPLHPNPEEGAVVELWWNHEQRIPLRVVRRFGGGDYAQELTDLVLLAQGNEALSPRERWPDYALMDLVDYREELEFEGDHHHDH